MPDLNHDDIVQQYHNTTIFYKGKPHKVKRIGMDDVTIMDLRTQRRKDVEFKLKDFLPVQTRLGMVNMDGVSVYVRRTIRKQYLTGLNNTNTECVAIAGLTPIDRRVIVEKVKEMECPEFADMLLGHYPTVQSAYNQAVKIGGTVAFDKQWALDAIGNVFLRTELIGQYENGKIVLDKSFKHFGVLLKENHEEAVRNFR